MNLKLKLQRTSQLPATATTTAEEREAERALHALEEAGGLPEGRYKFTVTGVEWVADRGAKRRRRKG